MTVDQIMTRELITVEMDDTLQTARDLFNQHKFHHLMVVDGGRLVGVVSDRDLLKSISPFVDRINERAIDAATLQRRVHQIMTRKLVTVMPETQVSDAAALFIDGAISCLPVINSKGIPVGIITWRDLLRTLFPSSPAQTPLQSTL